MAVTVIAASARAVDERPAETPSYPLNVTAWYPLKIGNTWTYKAGAITMTTRVVKYEEFEKQLCARLESSMGDKVVAIEHVAVKKDGVYRCGFSGKKAEPPLLFLKLPVEKDQTWTVNTTADGDKIVGTLKSGMIEEEVKVPAGTYKGVYTTTGECDAKGVKVSFTYYFAKDVGMIKQISKVPGQEVTLELEKFEPGK